MAGPGLIVNRRIAPPTKLRLQLVYARASEALAETYKTQAAEFVRRLKTRLSVEEALDRYFHEVDVPAALAETVRARALISLAGLIESAPRNEAKPQSWSSLRPDLLLSTLRRRVQHVEETNLECRLAASMSDEAVAETHVRMALETAAVLVEQVTPDEAVMHYIRTFNLPAIDAQVIYRSALARWAELHPLPGEAKAFVRQESVDPSPIAEPKALPRPRPELRNREFGLRVMV